MTTTDPLPSGPPTPPPAAADPPSPGRAPAGWYPDQARTGWRYWDGSAWTVTDAEFRSAAGTGSDDSTPEPTLRGGGMAALGALVALVASAVGSVVGMVIDGASLVALSDGTLEIGPATILGSSAGLWFGLGGVAFVNSRRHGTGRFRDDAALTWHGWASLGFCVVVAVALRVLSSVVAALVAAATGTSGDAIEQIPLSDATSLPVLAAVLVVTAVIGAPIAEELFFRGVVLDTLRRRWGAALAVVVSSILFAFVHAGASTAGANLTLIAGILPVGAALALVRLRRGSLAEAIVIHALFNATAVAYMIATHGT